MLFDTPGDAPTSIEKYPCSPPRIDAGSQDSRRAKGKYQRKAEALLYTVRLRWTHTQTLLYVDPTALSCITQGRNVTSPRMQTRTRRSAMSYCTSCHRIRQPRDRQVHHTYIQRGHLDDGRQDGPRISQSESAALIWHHRAR